jgi:hypothetical protein
VLFKRGLLKLEGVTESRAGGGYPDKNGETGVKDGKGDADALFIMEIETPQPQTGEILVKVKVCLR